MIQRIVRSNRCARNGRLARTGRPSVEIVYGNTSHMREVVGAEATMAFIRGH